MKKNLFFLLFLAVGAMSCQKDIEQGSITAAVTPTDTKQTSLFDQTKPAENDDVYVKIDAFKAKLAKIEAGTLPESDNGTSESDAIWNIEALLNSQYGRADKPFKKISSATQAIRVALNADGTISNTALLTALNAAEQKVTEQFNAVNSNTKHIIAIDISRKEPQIESGETVLLDVSSSVGFEPTTPLGPDPMPEVFGPYDFWLFGFHLGKCNNSGFVGTDAADKLNEAINPRFNFSCTFFTDVVNITDFTGGRQNPNDMVPGDNIRDFLFFLQRSDQPNFDPCINADDMNFYFAGAKTMIGIHNPVGKSFISINLIGTSTNSLVFSNLHGASISYGVKRKKPNCL
jgi:hypothetical protein